MRPEPRCLVLTLCSCSVFDNCWLSNPLRQSGGAWAQLQNYKEKLEWYKFKVSKLSLIILGFWYRTVFLIILITKSHSTRHCQSQNKTNLNDLYNISMCNFYFKENSGMKLSKQNALLRLQKFKKSLLIKEIHEFTTDPQKCTSK